MSRPFGFDLNGVLSMSEENELCVSKTHNLDVAGISSRLSRFISEALKCQSANVAHVMEHDLRRLYSFLKGAQVHKDWVVSTPQLDTPEFHPREIQTSCPSLPAIDAVENESIKDWSRLVYALHYEMVHSQSSRMSTGLIAHDAKRFDDIVTKLNKFLKEYVETTLPLDLPETVPMRQGVEPGKLGI